jgi:hypothetical protein
MELPNEREAAKTMARRSILKVKATLGAVPGGLRKFYYET